MPELGQAQAGHGDEVASPPTGRMVSVLPGVGTMLIRGFEEYRGGAVLQEWEVTPLDQAIGEDGLKHWNWPR